MMTRLPALLFLALPFMARGQSTSTVTTLTYIPGSSLKLEQVIGDCDYQLQAQQIVKGLPVTCAPTTSQTAMRFNVLGNGQGGAFEANGRMIFFFGDTISKDPATVNYHGADPIAWSTSTDPEKGLLLNFYTQTDGSPLFVKPPGITMGPDDIPNSGIYLNGQVYFICNTGSDTSAANPQASDYSVLVQFDEVKQTFAAGRTISPVGGRFIGTAMRALWQNVYIFGAGPYRASDVYLQTVPAASFASGAGTQYFAGLVNGQPTWTNSEAGAVPVVQDNPTNGPVWPNDSPTVGNVSVIYSSALNLWFMSYDGGRQSAATRGVYFTYAPQPWGPWATPQMVFNEKREKAYGLGGYVHDPNVVPDPPGDGLNGPTIGNLAGSNDPYTTAGGTFAPLMIERFTTVNGTTLRIYYNLSTWNPYTIVRVRSEFTIATLAAPAISPGGVGPIYSAATTIQPGSWVSLYGNNLASGTTLWNGDFPTRLGGTSVSVDGKPAYLWLVSPGQINLQAPDDSKRGAVSVVVTTAAGSATSTVTLGDAGPSFSVLDAKHVAGIILRPNGMGTQGGGSYDILGPTGMSLGYRTAAAKAGDTVVLFGVGFGPTSRVVPAGAPFTGSTPITSQLRLTINGTVVTPAFAGLTGAGLYQFNLTIPPGLGSGDLQLLATVDGIQTPSTVVISLQ